MSRNSNLPSVEGAEISFANDASENPVGRTVEAFEAIVLEVGLGIAWIPFHIPRRSDIPTLSI